MRRLLSIVVLCLAVALAGPVAAKVGGSSKSFGSMGSRTYDRPMERTYTPPPPAMAPVQPAAPMMAQPRPFMSGFMGGMLGAGIGSMLFGHGMGGGLLPLLLIGGVIWFVARLFRGGSALPRPMASAPPARVEKQFEPSDTDKQAFAALLDAVQRAWSASDLAALRPLVTPEMVALLSEDLSRDASRGVRNVMGDCRLLKGDVVASWRDGQTEYVTAQMTFVARDFTVRITDQAVVEGDPNALVESTEAWTFVRFPGGHWLLSAVER